MGQFPSTKQKMRELSIGIVESMQAIPDWFAKNSLRVSLDKTEFIRFVGFWRHEIHFIPSDPGWRRIVALTSFDSTDLLNRGVNEYYLTFINWIEAFVLWGFNFSSCECVWFPKEICSHNSRSGACNIGQFFVTCGFYSVRRDVLQCS